MESVTLDEKALIKIIKEYRSDLKESNIELKERCLTDEGLKLYFDFI